MTTKIIVKNGDWDKARAELGNVLDQNRARFDAQFEAAFGTGKAVAAAPAPAKPAPAKAAGPLVLSRPVSRLA